MSELEESSVRSSRHKKRSTLSKIVAGKSQLNDANDNGLKRQNSLDLEAMELDKKFLNAASQNAGCSVANDVEINRISELPQLDQSLNSGLKNLRMKANFPLNAIYSDSDTMDKNWSSISLKRFHPKNSSSEESVSSEKPLRKQLVSNNDDQFIGGVKETENGSASSPGTSSLNSRVGQKERLMNLNNSMLSIQSTSSNGLKSIPVRHATNKPFLVGSIASGQDAGSVHNGSLMGMTQLQEMFPEKRLTLNLITWNVNGLSSELYSQMFEELLFPKEMEFMADVYVICLQEFLNDKNEMLICLQTTLGPNFILHAVNFLGALGVCVFLRRDLIWVVSVPELASISTRVAYLTKGAVAVSFMIFGSSFIFISSHFKADSGNFENRVDDYKKIIKGLNIPQKCLQYEHQQNADDVTKRFDNVFWAGDFNFRIAQSRKVVERLLDKISQSQLPNYEELLNADELCIAQSEGQVFSEFEEGRINFPPTYKFDINSDTYDTSSKMRIPSYTDRILFRCKRKRSINCVHYNYNSDVKCSDHRAVYGHFEVALKPGSDNIPLSAGEFHRDIYIEGNQRRALRLNAELLAKRKPFSKVCVVM